MKNESHLGARVLIVDDEPTMVEFLTTVLYVAGYKKIRGVTDPRGAASAFQAFRPDLVLLDLKMPHLDGLDVLEQLHALMDPEAPVPVILLTASTDEAAKLSALEMGANDYIGKPFSPVEVRLRIANLLTTRFLQLGLRNRNRILRDELKTRSDEDDERFEALKQLATAAERHVGNGSNHPQRVASLSRLIALALDLPEDQAHTIEQASFLHDIGKIGVPEDVLRKPGPLTGEEYGLVKRHTDIGARILGDTGGGPFIETARDIARTHHERWDGSGYAGLARDEIPIGGRITSLAETFDVMIHDRPHRKAVPVADAIDEIAGHAGSQFDPDVVRAFLRVFVLYDLTDLTGVRGVIDLTDE